MRIQYHNLLLCQVDSKWLVIIEIHRYSKRCLGSGVFLQGWPQLEVAHQAMQIVGVHAQ